MSIAGSLSSALSGLTANARAAEVVSSNISNALTPGYGRRELVISAREIGGSGQGVEVIGVYRHADRLLIGDRRLAESAAGENRVRSQFLSRLEGMLGRPGDAISLNGRIAAFDAALIEAASRPESEARLSRVTDTARGLAGHLSAVSTDLQAARTRADASIGAEVQVLNTALTRIGALNALILANSGNGRDSSALMDQRQQVIDQVAAIVPVREVPRDRGVIALITQTGASLVDGRVAQFGFAPAGQIVAEMTQGTGALSGLTLNGTPIATAGDAGPIAGGTLAASFAVRDDLGPRAQAQVDGIARDLVDRFATPGLDSTRAPGDPGLFTDAGGSFDPVNETGLSQRLTLNAAVDPERGGAVWRLRDGLGATSPGPTGNAGLLNTLQAVLTDRREPVSATFTAGQRSLSALATDMLSLIASHRLTADSEASFSAARADSLRTMELEAGVDTDREVQTLLLIEQNYAANAKVVQTVDEMIKLLLGI